VTFTALQCKRGGVIHGKASVEKIFPLLCPKREEDWIPGWECETIWSRSGYNEEGCVFRTTKPYYTELYWTTIQYDITDRIVDFLITAPHKFVFRFQITLHPIDNALTRIEFKQVFTSVSEEGNSLIKTYENEDYQDRLNNLEMFMNRYLESQK
jgi:hypothetical protein